MTLKTYSPRAQYKFLFLAYEDAPYFTTLMSISRRKPALQSKSVNFWSKLLSSV